jgi:hypothetical protein
MQHIQRLVGREGHQRWCGGTIPVAKLPGFVHKMEQRYPITRNARERTYDRQRGRAVVHMIVFPIEAPGISDSRVAWWLLSGPGAGGLQDSHMCDAHVAKDAMSSDGHIELGDYVLVYATKKEPRTIVDSSGRSRSVLKDTSSWTWKLRNVVLKELRAQIDLCCDRLEYGAEGGADGAGRGLRGLLATQRERPLFSGVRTQIIELHRYARDAWAARRKMWLSQHPKVAAQSEANAGALRPIANVIDGLPKMVRLPVYDDAPRRVRDLLSP